MSILKMTNIELVPTWKKKIQLKLTIYKLKKIQYNHITWKKKLIAIDIEWKQEIWREETLLTIHTKYLLDKQSTMI